MEVLNLNDEMGHPIKREPGDFAFVRFYCAVLRREMVQWNYTDGCGKVHTGVAADVELAANQAALASGDEISTTRQCPT